MARVDSENVLNLIINEDDPLRARLEYIIWSLQEYDGEYVDRALVKLEEAMFYYCKAFDQEYPDI
jgi:hypothetical protein